MINIIKPTKIVGIYKITSPSGKIYIGQSTDINDRKNQYKGLYCKRQTKLYNSLKKYGFDAHNFDIIEECPELYLNELETWWKMFYGYQCVEKGLNHNYWDQIPMRGLKHTQESKDKISESKTDHVCYLNPKRGEKIGKSKLGKKQSKETCLKKSKANKNKPKPKDFGDKISKAKKGISLGPMSKLCKSKISKTMLGKGAKPIFQYDLNMNLIGEFESIRQANKSLGKSPDGGSIIMHLRNKLKSAYGFIWKYK